MKFHGQLRKNLEALGKNQYDRDGVDLETKGASMSSTPKPSHEEEEYFAKIEIEKKRVYAEKVRQEMATEELEKLKELHRNHCSKCGFEMHSILFKGVNIEKCPNCGGIFLDAGELEQLAGQESGFISSVLGIFKF